jgi:hypothetical protein
MNKQQLEEMQYCLSDGKINYTYFKDKYCMFLLQHFITQSISVNALKKSHYAQFCNKPKVKQWLSHCGSKFIEPEMIMALWQNELHHFTVTFGQWGGDSPSWQQTCRKGYNLVLQLNFSKTHDRMYEKVTLENSSPFTFSGHPVSSKRNTLAWSRLDFSGDFSEVLIEEVQNDWLRRADRVLTQFEIRTDEAYFTRCGINFNADLFRKYFDTFLKPIKALWDEAILCATLEFLAKEIGVKHVYYYEHNTGATLKSLKYSVPPKSLYTKLPKKFGFKQVNHAPDFINQDRFSQKKLRRIKSPQWHYLQL